MIDKDLIIRTVSQLESYADIKPHSPRTLPGSLIMTTLNLPVGSMEQNVIANFANPQKLVDLRSSATPPSTNRPRNSSSTRSNSKNGAHFGKWPEGPQC